MATSKTRLSYLDRIENPDLTTCECVPPVDVDYTLLPVRSGIQISWTAKTLADPNLVVASTTLPAWLVPSIVAGRLHLEGKSTGAKVSGVVEITNGCGEATFTVNIPEACGLPCSDGPADIFVDVAGQTITDITLLAAGSRITATTGLDKAAVAVYGKNLSIIGDVVTGPYTITVVNPCGPCVIEGEILREVRVVAPICEPIRITEAIGSTQFKVDEYGSICYVVQGTNPKLVTFENIPNGLNVSLTPASGTTPARLCISGTPTVDKCAVTTAGCTTTKISLSNCAGIFDYSPKLYVGAQPVAALRPVFCVGIVTATLSESSPAGTTCWDVAANFFPPNTELRVYLARITHQSANTPLTEGDAADIANGTALTIGDDGSGTLKFCPITSGSGCAAAYLAASHPTCGVVSNIASLSRVFTILNDCNSGNTGN